MILFSKELNMSSICCIWFVFAVFRRLDLNHPYVKQVQKNSYKTLCLIVGVAKLTKDSELQSELKLDNGVEANMAVRFSECFHFMSEWCMLSDWEQWEGLITRFKHWV